MFRVTSDNIFATPNPIYSKPKEEEKRKDDEKEEKQQQPPKKPNIQMFSKIDITYGIDADSC